MQTNILEYLEQTVTRVPDKVAFANDVMGITFRETYDQARSVGSFLNAEGFYKQPVVVFMKKHPTTLVSFFGTIYSGNYYVPLDDEMPSHRIDLILRTLKPKAMICDEDTCELVKQFAYEGKTYIYSEICRTPVNAEALVMSFFSYSLAQLPQLPQTSGCFWPKYSRIQPRRQVRVLQ